MQTRIKENLEHRPKAESSGETRRNDTEIHECYYLQQNMYQSKEKKEKKRRPCVTYREKRIKEDYSRTTAIAKFYELIVA